MKSEILTLCDFATLEMAGKLNILGAFDHINASQVPVIWPLCAVALRIRSERLEEGAKRIQVLFTDADGAIILPTLDLQLQIRLAQGESTAIFQTVVIVQQLRLPNFGEYAIDLRVDGTSAASIPLYVRQMQVPPQQQIPPQETPPPPH